MSVLPVTVPAQPNRVGTGVPANSLGNNGDTYLDRSTGRTWEKVAGAYGIVFQPTLPTSKLTGTIDLATQVSGLLPYSSVSGGPKITTSTIAGGPPGSPSDGDIWIATAVDANGLRWHFQYNAGSGSSLKWEFIGGAAARSAEGGGSSSSTTYADLTAPVAITVARAGDYTASFGGNLYNSVTTNHVYIALVKGAVAASDGDSASIQNHPVIDAISVAKSSSIVGIAAAGTIKVQGRVVGGTGNFGQVFLHVTPVRIS